MANSDVLHDHPRSKKARGEEVAKKGDRVIREGREYESMGEEEPDMYFDRPPQKGIDLEDELPHGPRKGKEGRPEYWRRVKKDVPTS